MIIIIDWCVAIMLVTNLVTIWKYIEAIAQVD